MSHTEVFPALRGRSDGPLTTSVQRLHNWSFDSEILFIARLRGYQVTEIPVSWRNDQGTKVRVWKDAAVSFLGLLQIRLNQILGKYG